VMTLFGAFALMFLVHPPLALMTLAILPLIAFIVGPVMGDLADLLQILGDARHQMAGLLPVEEAEREPLALMTLAILPLIAFIVIRYGGRMTRNWQAQYGREQVLGPVMGDLADLLQILGDARHQMAGLLPVEEA
jgi:ABC-type multidrug transport system fused ATPase/permease subunit